ncbi:CHAT domain-containing protein [Actinomycetospora soli]|uniref:CHAT domain-containing protein n=1 Tax=Actinomycetospora soli TaxID=2893887 RepID=UPI001E32599B|nr:CHAT domain-containing protein [Actinomycetospora soli]MCD2187848.1 CHAT domain-containing protein [Actinomycetospora soli]
MTASWLALEPVGDDVVWALSAPEGVVDAGLMVGTGGLRDEILAAVPGAGGSGLWTGPWSDPRRELDLVRRAGSALIPAALRARLGPDSTVTLAVRGWLATVPWDTLVVDRDDDTRLLESTRVVGGLPPTVFPEHSSAVVEGTGHAVRIIDPGPSSVGRIQSDLADWWWDRCGPEEDVLPLPGGSFGSDELAASLAGPADRLLYFGHAVGGTPEAPAAAGLVLTGPDGGPDVFTAHRWLGDPATYPCPPRVGLVACGSDDGHHVEQSGLPVAAVHAGARLVVATRWALPVDPALGAEDPATRLGLAVDAALAAPDPVAAVRAWQLERLRAWRAGGARADAPLLWGALVTYRAPEGAP